MNRYYKLFLFLFISFSTGLTTAQMVSVSDSTIYKPLILLDQIPGLDVETILSLSPEKIDHVDIINATYVRGNMRFGGIIGIFSREGDLAGTDFPPNSYIFSFKSYEPQQEIEFPDYSTNLNDERIPDFRNCLFWVPNIGIDTGEEVRYDFCTSDNQGDYIIVVLGITSDGVMMEGQCHFLVK